MPSPQLILPVAALVLLLVGGAAVLAPRLDVIAPITTSPPQAATATPARVSFADFARGEYPKLTSWSDSDLQRVGHDGCSAFAPGSTKNSDFAKLALDSLARKSEDSEVMGAGLQYFCPQHIKQHSAN
jgi:hypothetical protein